MSFKDLEQTVLGLCNDVMGQDVSYTPYGDSPITIKGVFDNSYVDVGGVISLKPILRINLADLSAKPTKRDLVSIDSVDYILLESREDGYGGTTLILQKD